MTKLKQPTTMKNLLTALVCAFLAITAHAQNNLTAILAINGKVATPAGNYGEFPFTNTTGHTIRIVKTQLSMTPQSGTYYFGGSLYIEPSQSLLLIEHWPQNGQGVVYGMLFNKEEDFGINYVEVAPGQSISLYAYSLGGTSSFV